MGKYIDYKCVIWYRSHLEDDVDNKKIIKLLKKRQDITNEKGLITQEPIYETVEDLSLEDNDGLSTIEFHDDNNGIDSIVWQNGKDNLPS